ncbi:hypothetical protein, unlikely [Trypanosoma brucei gambiense DAL972]|uniref:Uncharacterized protein n=1 Tax=Trypanosoma brucei gambiense (strain MHOM/CI/86/DAL972) TaxID=679716 RepID=C9ZSF2_TRYB9|nr:hypothetical protein, unlikely [Trypanosoma brucei gambiense DAL972]CBH12336.1 hypothetical protein, unlikely [Trypanosoma brucei gambiense DAL972]|eukprot:XP_011774617.1 hypothetical protein, unlikely [Trypanosoma brucei gambiense DAL972]
MGTLLLLSPYFVILSHKQTDEIAHTYACMKILYLNSIPFFLGGGKGGGGLFIKCTLHLSCINMCMCIFFFVVVSAAVEVCMVVSVILLLFSFSRKGRGNGFNSRPYI